MENVTGGDVYKWCVEKGIDRRCSFGLGGDFDGISDELVLKEVVKLYGVCHPYVVDRWKGSVGNTVVLLISNDNSLDSILLPGMIALESVPARRMKILWPEMSGDGGEGDIPEVPNQMEDIAVDGQDKSMGVNVDTGRCSSAEAVVDKVVSQLERWQFEGGYRRLRIFSGIIPVPAGEENFELWREAAVQHSEEWQCPEHVKRQRVVESLRGPAMGVIQATRRSNPKATLGDYLEALDFSYGTLEDVEDLLARLNSTYQEYGESLTHYIYRVDRLIYKIIDKGGMNKTQADENRIKQVLKGALTSSPVAQKLRCTMCKASPPTLSELVREVKLEEVQIENREKTIKKVKVVIPAPDKPSLDERLLTLIEEQNKKIEQLIALQSSKSSQPYRMFGNYGRGQGMNRRGENRNPLICYACGQVGHRAFECPVTDSEQRENRGYNRQRSSPSENLGGSSVAPSQTPQS
ncbi:paraneoplastic antigen Ma2-like [Pseudophryne corroboree]|uniref:paraneoplastic antigen Ma2-like n=1 Tax=Pseudophryne corroboree TaxID=495146 RepID=UPI003081657F